MPRDDQKHEAARNEVLASLNDAEKEKFHELEEMIKNASDDLTLHRAVGKFVIDSGLLKKVKQRTLSWACGFGSDAWLGIRVRLAKDFTPDQVKHLQAWQISLGVVQATAIIRNAKKRWAFLLETKEKKHTAADVRLQLKAKMASPHPYGGRPRKTPQSYSAEVDLAELVRLSRLWLHNYKVAKTSIKGRRKLLALVKEAADALGRLLDAVEPTTANATFVPPS